MALITKRNNVGKLNGACGIFVSLEFSQEHSYGDFCLVRRHYRSFIPFSQTRRMEVYCYIIYIIFELE